MNNSTSIDLEMQVENELNWEERSLSYLCRSFDQLNSGADYSTAGPAIHIGFLDFTPFKDYSEFYATYKLLNVKNHRIYSDKFILSVVDLKHIELATDEDKAYRIDYWARLFKATTWEEIRMIAKNDKDLLEASETLYALNCEKTIRDQCRAREDYDRLQNTIKKKINELTAENSELTSKNNHLSSEVEYLQKLLDENGIPYKPSN
jgi:predicted transposase/invertase (TIGR01784 family)